jgi:ribonuclease D
LSAWREREARARDLPRPWILPDAGILDAAQSNPPDVQALRQRLRLPEDYPDALAGGALEALQASSQQDPHDMEPGRDLRPTAEQKSLLDRLAGHVDAVAGELGISAEILAPRGELKALALGGRDTACLHGWRREVVGAGLLASLDP